MFMSMHYTKDKSNTVHNKDSSMIEDYLRVIMIPLPMSIT